MADFNRLIKDWYRQNKRELPWRKTKDPYLIWLSEIILQQTRVEQGLSYYNKFKKSFPTIYELANASEQDILNHWQGLGYYSRARNLHFTAKKIVQELDGKFPDNYSEIINLKGIGQYTAAAIASFSFKEKVAVVDGNVFRVLSRYFDIGTPIDSSEGKKIFFKLAQELIDPKEPDLFNQAIMEFGALQCKPVNPNCLTCPLEIGCLALQNKTIKERPVKSKKTVVKNRYLQFMIFEDKEYTYLQQRTNKDIWQNLYQFPLIETTISEDQIEWKLISSVAPEYVSSSIVHVLSHQRLHCRFYHFKTEPLALQSDWIKIKTENIQDYPLPRLIDRYLQK